MIAKKPIPPLPNRADVMEGKLQSLMMPQRSRRLMAAAKISQHPVSPALCVCMCEQCVQVRAELVAIGSVLLPCISWQLNSGCQAWGGGGQCLTCLSLSMTWERALIFISEDIWRHRLMFYRYIHLGT